MKIKLWIVLMLVGFLSTTQTIGQNVRPIEGFRGLKWGTPVEIASFKNKKDPHFNLLQVNGKTKIYTVPDDKSTIGTVNLKDIYYYFHDDAGFYKIYMEGSESENDAMDALLKYRLGKEQKDVLHTTHGHLAWNISGVLVDYKEFRAQDFELTIKSEVLDNYMRKANQEITDF